MIELSETQRLGLITDGANGNNFTQGHATLERQEDSCESLPSQDLSQLATAKQQLDI